MQGKVRTLRRTQGKLRTEDRGLETEDGSREKRAESKTDDRGRKTGRQGSGDRGQGANGNEIVGVEDL
jgi:hypothetical protein